MRFPVFIVLLALAGFTLSAKEKLSKVYLEQGTVTAIHSGERPQFIPGYNGNSGQLIHHGTETYRIETKSLVYEFSETSRKPTLSIGQSVHFRMEKDRAYA
jgi:hypothetical protein